MELTTVSDFVEDLMDSQYHRLKFSGLAGDLIKNPDNFRLKELKDRTEVKILGRDKIPHHGTIYFNKKDSYDYQNERERMIYDELKNNPDALAVIERVKNFDAGGQKRIKLVIERYLVMEIN